MQLVAGRVAQEFNQRKKRKGAFWEDRYHATAVAADDHFARCLTYIDLNMIRAGVVDEPADWPESGYAELMQERQRYHLLDFETLEELLGAADRYAILSAKRRWVEEAVCRTSLARDFCWSESLAVGDESFVDGVKAGLGFKDRIRTVKKGDEGFVLRESEGDYTELETWMPMKLCNSSAETHKRIGVFNVCHRSGKILPLGLARARFSTSENLCAPINFLPLGSP